MSESISNADQKAHQSRNGTMEKWDFVFKVVTTLTLIFGAIWGLKEYFDKKDRDFQQRLQDYQAMRFRERKETLYPLCNAVAEIVTSRSLKEAAIPIKKFETLYFGELGIIDDGEIAKTVYSFVNALNDYKEQSEDSRPPFNLIEQSSYVAGKCKAVLDLETVYGFKTEKKEKEQIKPNDPD
jgi:hypothetical protein